MSATLHEIIPTKQPPAPGQLVTVRNRRFVVTAVAGSGTQEHPAAAQNLVTLSSVEDDALGEELQVVWEIEPGAGKCWSCWTTSASRAACGRAARSRVHR